jgi:hypothetical protein
VAADGVVASLKSGVATVLGRGSVLTRELVRVVSMLLTREAGSLVVTDGVHSPMAVDVPYGDVIGSGATAGVKLTKGLTVTEEDDE